MVLDRFSVAARLFTTRGILLILALAGAFSIWQGHEFFLIFPFNIQLTADIVFVLVFLFFTWHLPRLLPERQHFVQTVLFIALVYMVLGNIVNLWTYTDALGLMSAAERAGLAPLSFLLQEFLLLVLAPVFVVGFLMWLISSIKENV